MSSTMITPSRPSVGVDFRPKHRWPLPTPKLPNERQKKESVTIAAGFKFKDGILLCADREITEGISKFSESKLFGEQIGPDVSLTFTLAGAMDYAEMAIQEIIAAVKSSQHTTHAEIRAAMSDTVRDIYSEAIGGLLQSRQTEAGFGLLLGVWAEGQLKLYASEDTAVKEVPQFRCIGIGKELAKYVLSRDGVRGSDRMSVQTAEAIALRIIQHVKESVSGCGKETDVLILDSRGVLTRKSQSDYHFELKMIEMYDQMTSVLLPFSLELDMPEEDREIGFRLALSNYFQRLKILQDEKHNQEEAEREED